jgi:hypothetical protein
MSSVEGRSEPASDTAGGETVDQPGRVDPAQTSFASAADLADAMRRASAAHAKHEERIGAADPNWPDWYALYMVREQAGEELPS